MGAVGGRGGGWLASSWRRRRLVIRTRRRRRRVDGRGGTRVGGCLPSKLVKSSGTVIRMQSEGLEDPSY